MGTSPRKNRIGALLLVLLLMGSLLPTATHAAEITWEEAYALTGNMLEEMDHTVGAEWVVIGLSRSGRQVSSDYYDLLAANIRENADDNNRLHRSKATVNDLAVVTLTAMGADATDVDGVDLIAGLGSMDFVKKQGISGVIWTLIALNSGNYAPCGDVTRGELLEIILTVACPDGGWATSGKFADPDMTGMALQALAPYCDSRSDVRTAAEGAVETLSRMQKEDGGFATMGLPTSESTAQVIVALTALGIDPDTDPRFCKNGNTPLDALLAYYVEGGGFRHVQDGERDGIATEQGYYALTAYKRFLEGKTALYDMTDVVNRGGDGAIHPMPELTEPDMPPPPATEPGYEPPARAVFPWWLVGLAIACIAVLAVLFRKRK